MILYKMVERPTSDRIQKTSSKIVLIGLAAATMMITVSIVGAIQLQEASAAKPQFCYQTVFGYPDCWGSMQTCRYYQELNEQAYPATGPCRAVQP